jgi:hypothetical protein
MRFKLFITLIILLLALNSAHAATNIIFGGKPTFDGVISPDEWQDATLKTFTTSGGTDSVWLKYFQDTIFMAIKNPNTNSTSLNWVLLDINFDRSAAPQADDHILSVIIDGNRYEKIGNGAAWEAVPIQPVGWVDSVSTGSGYWMSEWKIFYSKLGLVKGMADTFGFAVSNFVDGTGYWWPTGVNYNTPSTWEALTSSSNWGMPQGNLTVSNWDCGSIPTNDSMACDSIFLKNSGTYGLSVSDINITSGAFTTTITAPQTIEPGDSLFIPVIFKPAIPGTYNDTLVIITDDPVNQSFYCQLSGIGVEVTTVDVPLGSKPSFDGVLSPGEWSDAVFITPHTSTRNDTVWFKYNLDTLYAGFKGADSFAGNQQQLYFDKNYDRATLPIEDDYRLRTFIGGGIEENIGAGYGWVGSTVSGWNATGTATSGGWCTEWKIALSKLDILPGTADSVGMAAVIYSFAPGAGGNYWPVDFNWENPSTWGMMKSSQKWGVAAIATNENQHDFGYINPDDSLSWTSLYIKNAGSLDLDLDSLCFGSGYFMTDPLGDSLLAPGDSVAVAIWFKPNSSGAYLDTLRIYSNDPVNNPDMISLAGNGAYIIDVPWGTVPKFEGTIEPLEWADAYRDSFELGDKVKKYHNVDTFWVKYNADTIYMALITPNFTDYKITSHSLMFDTKFDRTLPVQDDDYRFMVTFEGEQVEFTGFKNQWEKVTPVGWCSAFSDKDHLITFYAVPFDRLGLSIGFTDTIGFAVLADGDGGIYGQWPAASDSVGPVTWGILTSSSGWTGIMSQPNNQPKIRSFSLANAYPNPANKQAILSYQLPASAKVTLKIYNITGQLVKSFDQGQQPAGSYSVRCNTGTLSNGIYFYQLEAGSFKATKRLLVVK